MLNPRYEGWEENECWIDMDEFPNHQLSTAGRVRNKRTGRVLKTFPDRYGYLRLSIGNVDNVYIHQLMGEYFYGPKPFLKAEVNHIDTNRQNNSFLNLEWTTRKGNAEWASYKGTLNYQKGLDRAAEVNRIRVRIIETGQVFDSVRECAEYFGVNPTCVSRCICGNRAGQRLHGYHLEYVDENERRCKRDGSHV